MLRRFISLSLVATLVGMMPGLEPYRAAAAVVNGNVGRSAPVTGAAGRVQVAPVQMQGFSIAPAALSAPSLSPTLAAPGVKLAVPVNAAAAAAPASIKATITPQAEKELLAAPAAVAPAASAKKVTVVNAFEQPAQQAIPETALGRLAIPMPEFGKMGVSDSKVSAESDFLTRIGFKSSSKKGQPDQRVGENGPDDDGTPQRGDTDELGNERRRQDPGPDDTWDGDQRGGGNDGLFATLQFSKSSSKSSKGGKSMPDQRVGDGGPDDSGRSDRSNDIDELGNERRQTDDGPDSVSDEFGGGSGNSGLFAMAAGLGVTGVLAAASVTQAVFTLALLLPALILHEMGHAKAASLLGDHTAKIQGRMSFRPKDLLTHIDPFFTLLIPFVTLVTSGFMFGGAKPVPVDASNFKDPVKDMAKVAFAGPATNFVLAVVGGIAYMGLLAAGVTGLGATVVAAFTFMNVFLGLFNLLPIAPLDGSHILRAFLPQRAAMGLDNFYAKLGGAQMIVMLLGAMLAAPFLGKLAVLITGILLSGGAAVGAFSMASAFLPAVAAAGILFGQMRAEGPKTLTAPKGSEPVRQMLAPRNDNSELIVLLDGAPRKVTADMHLSNVDLNLPNAVEVYAQTLQALQRQLAAAGIEGELLERYNVTPIASYKRINAATLQVDSARSLEFRKLLESRGYKVYDNARREIVKPVPIPPESVDPTAAGAITMEENLKITKSGKGQDEARARWGEPEMGFFAKLVRRVLRAVIPQPSVAVIDTGVDLEHPLLKRMKGAKDVGNTNGKDDNGHGTWVASTILNQAPWLRGLTSYKTFTDGGATLDDILKALTMAANDGNIIMSNSWGSDEGDPNSPDSQLVKKLAEEGHVMVFAAGNAGPRANTVGSPAIATYIDPATGAPYVIAVAATDRNKKTAFFSSRGPGSPMTKNDPKYPHRPDIAAPGYNTEGAWPTWMRGDRVDPKYGNLKAISGTSMSTPDVAGIIAHLAMLFGVTTKGKELSLIVKTLMETADKTSEGPDAIGHYGFVNVEKAFEALKQVMKPVVPNFIARWVLKLVA